MFLRVTATVILYYDLYCAMKMADFKTRELEFVRKGFAGRNNFSEGFSKPERDAREIRVRGTALPRLSSLELLVRRNPRF